MPVITLTSDWGFADHYVAVLKGTIMSAYPEVNIIDISHQIKRDDVLHGAFIMKNAWTHFPKGTVHVCGMTATAEKPPVLIAISHESHFFVGTDDGFFALVFRDMPTDSYHVLNSKGEKVMTGTKALASTAVFLAKGGKITDVGAKMSGYTKLAFMDAVTEDMVIRGMVIHVDLFGNLITNIRKEVFEEIARGRQYEIILRKRNYSIDKISRHYYATGAGEIVAHFNDAGYLELAISKGDAAQLLGMTYGEMIKIDFK